MRAVAVEGYRFRRDRRCGRELFRTPKLKHRRFFNGLLISLRQLLAPRLDLRMSTKLPLEHLERVDGDVRVTLRDVEVDALELLSHHVLIAPFIRRRWFVTRSRCVGTRDDAEVDFL